MSSASKTPSKAGATVSPKKLGTAGASTAGAAKEEKKSAAGSIFSVGNLVRFVILVIVGWVAYDIRLHAIKEYGLVIHEFDPWFNYRATEYLDQHGLEKFFKWFDYMSWYPLGKPVGTTIYPGMQMTSVFIKNTLNNMGYPISLNDVCCYVPAWFGVSATYFLGLLTYECSNNANAAVASAGRWTTSRALLPEAKLGKTFKTPPSRRQEKQRSEQVPRRETKKKNGRAPRPARPPRATRPLDRPADRPSVPPSVRKCDGKL